MHLACECNPEGSEDNFCNVDSGHCYCKTNNIAGDNCEKCAETFFGFPNCQGIWFISRLLYRIRANLTYLHTYILECQCNAQGSASDKCEDESGKCTCRPHVVGHKCDKCEPGYFGFPDCQRMYCSIRHSIVSENLKLFFSKRYSSTHVVWGNFGRYFYFAICNVKYPWLIKSRFWNYIHLKLDLVNVIVRHFLFTKLSPFTKSSMDKE